MDQCQQQRRAAAQAFMQSLNQLEADLLPDSALPAPTAPDAPGSHQRRTKMDRLEESFALEPPSNQSLDQGLDQSLAEAVADIEQFIRERQQEK